MDTSDPLLGPQNIDSSTAPDFSVPETDYGPWPLVSRWRGGFRGRGDGTHATHVSTGSAVNREARVFESRGAASYSARGGKSYVGRSRASTPNATHSNTLSGPLVSSPLTRLFPFPPLIITLRETFLA